MDNSREEDLKRLHEVFNNTNKSKFVRNQAYRSYQSIQRQVKDRKLVELRHRLIQAVRADDQKYIVRFRLLIREHSRRNGYEQHQG